MKGTGAAVLIALAWTTVGQAAQDFFASNPLDDAGPPKIAFGSRVALTLGATTSGDSVPIVTDRPTPTNPLPPLTSPIEDIFERKYWYLVLLDTKEVLTSPVRWNSRDWLMLGGIAAGIGTVAVFDEQIERGIRHARSDTATAVFDQLQPLGNEYA
ncbi:MAG: hypothetical protein ACREIW_04795, partial [Chthoniobacterales bacterium]